MTILKNYWVQKRYQSLADGKWMLFVWGMAAASMLHALEAASKKKHSTMKITEESSDRWSVFDPESDTRYIVERTDKQPEIPDGANYSIRDQTLPVREERKPMPLPRSLFKETQLPLL